MYIIHRGIKKVNEFLPVTNHWLILFASIPVALSTGTIFVYSVYSTELAQRCQLDASQTGSLNISATIGTAFGGLLGGLITDTYGTQLPILVSCVSISLGYKWLYDSYRSGPNSNMVLLLFSMFLVGVGSVSGYFSAIKAVTLNFPNYKSSAQSVTIASFAISSLLFSFISSRVLKGDIGAFLYFMHVACGLLIMLGFLFIRVDGHFDDKKQYHEGQVECDEMTGLLISNQSECEDNSDYLEDNKDLKSMSLKKSLVHPIFWYHYFILSLIQGFGQMYIYSIGFILKAIHYYYDNEVSQKSGTSSLQSHQALHVSLIAISSFIGRLSSGPQSDFLVRKLHCQRHWILILGLSLMFAGHSINCIDLTYLCSDLRRANKILSLASCIIGYAYGFSFTCYPAIISDLFNMRNYSFLWGTMYTSTTFGLALMTTIFGYYYDLNSTEWDHHVEKYVCDKGSGCYKSTFQITSGLCVFTAILVLGYIYTKRSNKPPITL
ncbi:DEHA2F10516p [Debaryomyces hansenii CBS767]|uniref:DEHA2F10516p n=1 Tax=Debaryomyces hansenii (strain ATCC 36239 / CBS 767 / BCRC 21394 / JCM 1990 / NBRC 0083 / IGC 2968) TaxID=284592 RepID=Q6BLV0_DEBHA|nr:DEHA2F10516p [Debaryomyces hansenii CBS767]CAG89164.2 DEHA2F10516p [Debaryomyces hansenii CBS767]|eukprot:XP_460821.2 DEHA2F10516p [Debaryomyces hansenii CBS767]